VLWRQKQQDLVRLPLTRRTKIRPKRGRINATSPLQNQRYLPGPQWHKSGSRDCQGSPPNGFQLKRFIEDRFTKRPAAKSRRSFSRAGWRINSHVRRRRFRSRVPDTTLARRDPSRPLKPARKLPAEKRLSHSRIVNCCQAE